LVFCELPALCPPMLGKFPPQIRVRNVQGERRTFMCLTALRALKLRRRHLRPITSLSPATCYPTT
jgi:hypothetical protein